MSELLRDARFRLEVSDAHLEFCPLRPIEKFRAALFRWRRSQDILHHVQVQVLDGVVQRRPPGFLKDGSMRQLCGLARATDQEAVKNDLIMQARRSLHLTRPEVPHLADDVEANAGVVSTRQNVHRIHKPLAGGNVHRGHAQCLPEKHASSMKGLIRRKSMLPFDGVLMMPR